MKKKPLKKGRPKMTIDWNIVNPMLEAGCSGEEIAAFLGCNADTLYLRCKKDHNMVFSAYLQIKAAKGDSLLRMRQFEVAYKDKDKAMLIWLGKNRLGQKDKKEIEVKDTTIEWNETKTYINLPSENKEIENV